MALITLSKTEDLALKDLKSKSLIESRIVLELNITRLAAKNRTNKDLESINSALQAFKDKVLNDEDALQEDLLFHLAIARATSNAILNKSFLMMAVEIFNYSKNNSHIDSSTLYPNVGQYEAIFNAIINQDFTLAEKRMTEYLISHYKNDFI